MHHDKADEYTVLLQAGTMVCETDTGWRAVHEGLRDEVIKAALNGPHAQKVRRSIRKRRTITFRDSTIDLTVRWSPVGVN